MNLTGRLSEALAGQRMSHADFWSETVEVAKRLDVDGPKLIRRGGLDYGADPALPATSEEGVKGNNPPLTWGFKLR